MAILPNGTVALFDAKMRLFAVVNPNDHPHQTDRDHRIYPLLIYLAILFDYQLITPHVNMGIGGLKPSLGPKKKSPTMLLIELHLRKVRDLFHLFAESEAPLAEGEG